MKYFLVLFSFVIVNSLQAQPEEIFLQPDSTVLFGHTVEVFGDHAMLWKGISNKNTVLVLKRSGEVWTEIAELEQPSGDVSQAFGLAIDMQEDQAVIAGPFYDYNGALNAGIVYIFDRSGDTWTNTASITPADIQGHDEFGLAVGSSGDVIIIGSPRDDNRGSNAGSAYIFRKDSGAWTQEALLEPEDGLGTYQFGRSVSISGDYAIVGVPFELGEFASVGAAYIFEKTETGWGQVARLEANPQSIVENFGHSVEIKGDLAMIGAIGADGTMNTTGAVYIYQRINGEWTLQQKIFASDGGSSESFGSSLAFEDNCVVIGAFGTGQSIGKVYFFYNNGMMWEEAGFLAAENGEIGNTYGFDVALSGGTLLVGSTTLAGQHETWFGAVYLYENACAAFIATGTEEMPSNPSDALLASNYPNPFSFETTIPFEIESPGFVELNVYNTLGQRVKSLTSGTYSQGNYQVKWDRRSTGGDRLPNGLYFYTLTLDGRRQYTRAMMAH